MGVHINTTVYFATNRVVTDAADAVGGYQTVMVAPSNPAAITYGTAFVTGVDVASGAQGKVSQVADFSKGGFSQTAAADLSAPGRNLLVFLHGFDNTFSGALTWAAFNREWLAASGNPDADATVIAFAWPSKGRIAEFPILTADYEFDRHMAEQSGLHLMSFFANLEPIIRRARASRQGLRVTLLAHSMGNLALQSAVESWFMHGNGSDVMFDQAILAAGDCPCNTFDQPNVARLSGLGLLADRISTYYSHADQVLQLSMVVNLGAQRLGQDGPQHRTDATLFPPSEYAMVNCSGFRDYSFDFLTSHQYYRQSPGVRAIIAAAM